MKNSFIFITRGKFSRVKSHETLFYTKNCLAFHHTRKNHVISHERVLECTTQKRPSEPCGLKVKLL